MKKMENLNNRLKGVMNNVCESYVAMHTITEEDADAFKMPFDMLFAWWMMDASNGYDNKKIQNLCNAEKVDFFDFVASTFFELSKIYKGKREFDFDNISEYGDKAHKKWYYKVDGVAIQKHNKVLAEYTLDFIDYMYMCVKDVDGAICLERYIN